MTADLLDPTTNEQLADAFGDAALASLLQAKPGDDLIPAAVWWLIAETLRTSVTIRRTVAADLARDREDLPMLIAEATLLTEAALADLAEATGARPTPLATPSAPKYLSNPTRPAFGLQLSVLFLARLLVSHRTTSPQRLANTLAAHLRALAAIDVRR
ncbi:MAG TPA: hypothetical protein VHV79_06400 [Mycobacteriales bacterium]|jgi:hypothetical protein|nr:hypothetical protein [Mycobacteriales bacterium]